MTDAVLFEVADHVATITINRPEAYELLPRLVGHAAAAEMLLTGDMIDANGAARIGLVSQVVPDDQLMATAPALAQRITTNAPLAVQAAKKALRMSRAGQSKEL